MQEISKNDSIIIFLYLSIAIGLLSYFAVKNLQFLQYEETLSISIGFVLGILSGIIGLFVIKKSDKIKSWYDEFIELLNVGITNKVRKDLESYCKIKDKDIRNLMIKSYIDNVFERTNSDIWTKVIMVINILVIVFNFIFVLVISSMNNINTIFSLLFQEKIKDIGAANVAQELGIQYDYLTRSYGDFIGNNISGLLNLFPMLFWVSFAIIFFGSFIYFISESAKNARNRAINRIIIEIYSK